MARKLGLDLVAVAFGQRLHIVCAAPPLRSFGQVIAGETNGLDSVFPTTSRAKDSANSLALYVGGGGQRAPEVPCYSACLRGQLAAYTLADGTTNLQNNLRPGAGLVFRL
jgi:hypothetical protein